MGYREPSTTDLVKKKPSKSYRLFSNQTPSNVRMKSLISDISKSEGKLVTSGSIKCEKITKPLKKTLIIRGFKTQASRTLKQKAALMRYKVSKQKKLVETPEI